MNKQRRDLLKLAAALPLASAAPWALAQSSSAPDIAATDRVFLTNEDSNTVSVIDPARNAVDTTTTARRADLFAR